MKISATLVLAVLLISFLALTAASQISQVTNAISVEEVKACTTSSYDEVQTVYGNCFYYLNYTNCLNTTGPNTACSTDQNIINFTCKTGEIILNKNRTDCQPASKFIVSIAKGAVTEKKEIDFSEWGVCVNSTENNCLVVTCGTLKGGSARNGIFNGCDGGKACQKFLFCPDGVRVLYKASRNDFVEYDPTFHLSPLAIKEVVK